MNPARRLAVVLGLADDPADAVADSDRPVEHHGYFRLGGLGITRTLYECTVCGAAVSNPSEHTRYHYRKGDVR